MKKVKVIQSAVMCVISILILIGFTVAWFSGGLGDATAGGMRMKAAEQGDIRIALESGGDDISVLDEKNSYVDIGLEKLTNIEFIQKDENGNTRGLITSIDLFNEIISFDKVNENGERDENGEYRNMWQLKYGITLEELMQTFSYALENKLEGVTYVYNEPFLEDVIIYSHTILLTLFICPFKLYFSLINSNSFS